MKLLTFLLLSDLYFKTQFKTSILDRDFKYAFDGYVLYEVQHVNKETETL